MQVIRNITELRATLAQARKKSDSIALVPTMGALHAGHANLIELARKQSDYVCLSIFINPLQFNSLEDLEKYPRTPEQDLSQARESGASLVFMPEHTEIYGQSREEQNQNVKVLAGSRSKGLCGAYRPGHFDGVVKIVSILFNLFRPDFAVFGEKDYQQLKVLEQLNADLHFGVKIMAAPLIRDLDGLALSSRNQRLSAEERKDALAIPTALRAVLERFERGTRISAELLELAQSKLSNLKVEYAQIVDCESLQPLQIVAEKAQLMVAAYAGSVRLIDNIRLEVQPAKGQ